MSNNLHILRLSCPDKPGIVAAVGTSLGAADCNIEEAAQFSDKLSGQFFMRVVFAPLHKNAAAQFQKSFTDLAEQYDMDWAVYPLDQPVKTLIMVSGSDHCLHDILYRWRTDHLNIDITAVVSNHEDCRKLVEDHGLKFHHQPEKNENVLREIIEDTGSELIVLARYMQILSNDMCRDYEGRIINIHHSFLPGFKGAKPYHQAYERGVKIIGATAHFATSDLDEGPIIEQETVRIDHTYNPDKMKVLGRDTEARVLARAIDHYAGHHIFLHGNRTVIL